MSKTEKTLDQKLKDVNRVEVVDNLGRAFVYIGQKKDVVTAELQDDGRTLKVFINDKV